MSHTNYSKMSTNKKNTSDKNKEKVEKVEEVVEPKIVEKVAKPEEPIEGIVSGCTRLNIRKKPNIESNVVCVVDVDSKLMIVRSESTKEWFRVYAENGKKGYCMKKYVRVR